MPAMDAELVDLGVMHLTQETAAIVCVPTVPEATRGITATTMHDETAVLTVSLPLGVIAGLVPAIQEIPETCGHPANIARIAGSSPAMTIGGRKERYDPPMFLEHHVPGRARAYPTMTGETAGGAVAAA